MSSAELLLQVRTSQLHTSVLSHPPLQCNSGAMTAMHWTSSCFSTHWHHAVFFVNLQTPSSVSQSELVSGILMGQLPIICHPGFSTVFGALFVSIFISFLISTRIKTSTWSNLVGRRSKLDLSCVGALVLHMECSILKLELDNNF